MNDDGFILHTSRIKKKRKGKFYAATPELTPEQGLKRLLVTLETKRKQLEEHREWWSRWRDLLDTVESKSQIRYAGTSSSSTLPVTSNSLSRGSCRERKILCLGIGKISESNEAKLQFLLLQDLARHFEVDSAHISVYDPLFTPVDLLLFRHHRINVLPCNQLGAHVLSEDMPTLVYLPHCPRELYESFLEANWQRKTWSDGRVLLLGNPLSQYTDKISATKAREEIPCVEAFACHSTVLELPELSSSHPAASAYNATAFQLLTADQADDIDWTVTLRSGADRAARSRGEIFTNEIGQDVSVSVTSETTTALADVLHSLDALEVSVTA